MQTTGIQALLEILAAAGVRHLFGNPGTTELPLSDALLGDARFRYILGLQEVPVVAMADGYAQASGELGVVNVHISCGLGNAMGMIYNAFRSHTPLLITAGQQDRRLLFDEPILWGQMVEVVRPWTKWACEVQRVEDFPKAVRRAVQTALMPPRGPVFLSLPLDLQREVADLDTAPPRLPSAEIRPPREAVAAAAELLLRAKNPAILVGNRVVEAQAVDGLVHFAELLAAPVFHESPVTHGRMSFPCTHGLAAGALPFWSPQIRQRLAEFDALVVVGMKLMQLYIYHEPPSPLPEGMPIVQIDENPWEIGKNHPVAVGVVGHPRPALEELAHAIEARMTPDARRTALLRRTARGRLAESERQVLRREAAAQRAARPMNPLALMHALGQAMPPRTAVIEESPTTTSGYLERSGTLDTTEGYFAQRGWALGWGLNCALGVKLAWPDRPVLGILGDGSAMYGIQGLWTAAHERIGVTFVVCNNREYRILKNSAKTLRLPGAVENRFHALDLDRPAIDFAGLARSLGVTAERVESADALQAAARHALEANEPHVIEVLVQPSGDQLRA